MYDALLKRFSVDALFLFVPKLIAGKVRALIQRAFGRFKIYHLLCYSLLFLPRFLPAQTMSKQKKKPEQKAESLAHAYDVSLDSIVVTAIHTICGLPPFALEKRNPNIKRLKEKRADLVFQIISKDPGLQGIIHIENQSANQTDMEYRMAEYKILLAREFKQRIHQYLIYVGAERMTMPDVLIINDLSYR